MAVLLMDFCIRHTTLPRPLFGALDETGHLTTALLLLSASRPLRAYPSHLLLGALPAAVLIDLDHVPSELFHSSLLTAGTCRPCGHTLIAALTPLAVSPLPRRRATRLVLRGVSLGLLLHLVRDLPTGGAPLLWPVTNYAVSYRYKLYAAILVAAAALATRTGTRRR